MIEIIEFKAIDKGALKAQISIRLPKWGGFRIKRIKIFHKENSRWLSLPSEEYEVDGKKKYYLLNDFEDDKMTEAFRKQIFKSYDEYLEKNTYQKTIPF